MENAPNMPSVTIGNYKGVMLCNRPFAGITAAAANTEKASADGFLCGTVAKPWGSNVAIAEKSRVLSRLSKKDGVLSKHRKWLADLQKKKELILQQKLGDEANREEKKRKFMSREAKNRMDSKQSDITPREIVEENRPKNDGRPSSSTPPIVKNSEMPAWALTETSANQRLDLQEGEECDELLSFVDGLDFEKYDDDFELIALIDQVKERVSQLEREKKSEESKLQVVISSEDAMARAEKFGEISYQAQAEYGYNSIIDSDECDVQSVAETVRSEATLKKIHSKKSTEAMVARSKEKMQANGNDKGSDETCLVPPLLVTHTDDNGARLAETKNLNKLPFKNRNPAL